MRYSSTVLALLAATASAAPLNINLGAYSPALVVGDGEISFGSEAAATGLVAGLQNGGGAAAGTAATTGKAVEAASVVVPAAASQASTSTLQAAEAQVVPTTPAGAIPVAEIPTQPMGMGMGKAKMVEPRADMSVISERQNDGDDDEDDNDAHPKTRDILSARDDTEDDNDDHHPKTRDILSQFEARDDTDDDDDDDHHPKTRDIEKRDIATLNAALAFASSSLTTGPAIELGTGEKGSGVGITVKPTAAGAAKAAAVPKTV